MDSCKVSDVGNATNASKIARNHQKSGGKRLFMWETHKFKSCISYLAFPTQFC